MIRDIELININDFSTTDWVNFTYIVTGEYDEGSPWVLANQLQYNGWYNKEEIMIVNPQKFMKRI